MTPASAKPRPVAAISPNTATSQLSAVAPASTGAVSTIP
jgi:hypothetical protein